MEKLILLVLLIFAQASRLKIDLMTPGGTAHLKLTIDDYAEVWVTSNRVLVGECDR